MFDEQLHHRPAEEAIHLAFVIDRDWVYAWERALIERSAAMSGISVTAIARAPAAEMAHRASRSWDAVTTLEKSLSHRLFHTKYRRAGIDHDRTNSLSDLSRHTGLAVAAADAPEVLAADYLVDLSGDPTNQMHLQPSQALIRFEWGEPNPNTGEADGAAEVLGNNPYSVCRLIINRPGERRVIERRFRTFLCSWSENARRLHWQGATLALDALKDIAEGSSRIGADAPQSSPAANVMRSQQGHHPATALIEMIRRSLRRMLRRKLTDDQWSVFLSRNFNSADTIRQYAGWQELKPPPDRAWADPFVIERDGKTCVFVEEVPHATQRGSIVCLELTPSGVHRLGVALDEPHHLSYPFLFEHQGNLFMLPESSAALELVLWKCNDFPLKWERHKVLFRGLPMVDATIVKKDDLWWLFTTIDRVGGGDLTAELHAFYAADPISDDWKPHALNPLIVDPRIARMAGTIADIDGRLIRFSQGSSFEYGDRLHMRRITSLTPTAYQEEDETTFYPAEGHIACHHFSRWNDVAVVDCCRRQPRWGLRSPSAKPHANPEIDLAIRAGTPPEPVK